LAEDVMTVRQMSLDLGAEIARKAVDACFEQGYQASAVVVDRAANVLVSMRHPNASKFTTEIATRKANTVILSSVSTGEFKKNRADIINEMNLLDDIMVLEGGLPIQAAGSLLGAVGVSGAPGGDKDAACAKKGIDAVQERLDFAE
jgi:uncharacterized protein GlcG (DUF336 family)